jgi:hypothetical protein
MTEVFADSYCWLALLNCKDADHERVAAIDPPGRLVTSWPVLLEVMDALSSPRAHQVALQLWHHVHCDPLTIIMILDADLLNRGISLFRERPDKSWSLTDCITFVIMQDRGVVEALTADRHFEQAGFHLVFKCKTPAPARRGGSCYSRRRFVGLIPDRPD